jgi:predicted acetyltransferase
MTSHDAPRPPYPVRTLGDDDWPGFLETDSHAFGSTMPAEVVDFERTLIEPGRSIGAFDGPTPVGIGTAFSFDLTVPGAVVPAAGISWVGVLPTHRRRGVLSALMTHQLQETHERGREPVAVLWASEPQIYGRFGYGLASRAFSLTVPRSSQALRGDIPAAPGVHLRLVPADDWKLTAAVYDEVAQTRPGMLRRDERWWLRAVRDPPSMREGRSELRCVVAEDEDGVRGFARYATKPDWTPGQPKGTVHVREVLAKDPAAKAALYSYLFDLDLMGSTELWNVPVDDPVLYWLENVRATQPRWMDALYVRLVDVPGALRARRYSAALDVVLEISDPRCPWNDGRWQLIADDDGVRCEHTEGAPDLTLSVTELGAAYLGGTSLTDLAMAGRVEEHTAGSLRTTSTGFTASPAPWCPIVF